MKTIWKFRLSSADRQYFLVPPGSRVLTVQLQDQDPVIWCWVDTDAGEPMVQKEIWIFGTGYPMPEGLNFAYIGTFQPIHGLVFHVFERVP
jgi:hypothetical protein